jgi:hypothetical protein
VKRSIVGLAVLIGSCGQPSSSPSVLPPRPNDSLVKELAAQTSQLLGSSFQPIFVCGLSEGRAFLPSQAATDWITTKGPEAIVVSIDEAGALEILKEAEGRLKPVTADGGLVVPVKFDPVAGDIAVAVAYADTGVSESYAFSTFANGPSFLTWTVNIPQYGQRKGGRGVEALIAQCVEIAVTPAGFGRP